MTDITASMLYDYENCPHRVSMELFSDPAKRDAVSPFVQLLWERGFVHERDVVRSLGIDFVDLSSATGVEREKLTREAMSRGASLIYSGQISADGLVGIPDFLRREASGYIAGDIKSGAAEEASGDDEEGKPKIHYAVQLALYTDILERIGLSGGRRAFIVDVHGSEVSYDLEAPYGVRSPRTLWQDYQECLNGVRSIIDGAKTLPAYSSSCKNCVWYTACLAELERSNDLTLIPFLGRSLRDTLISHIPSVRDLAESDPEAFLTDKGRKTVFPGLGPDRLRKFQTRAKLLTTVEPKAFLSAPVVLPHSEKELFFDIEVDPMRDICYLHGFVERLNGDSSTEQFIYFFADSPTTDEEKRAFADAWQYLTSRNACPIYYYSKYERTIYRKLQKKYPDICSADDIEALFDPSISIDLYFDVVLKATEWPTKDFSIKTLAKHLGFAWRDTHPSGAASIEWYHRWVESGDPSIKDRILTYNEDDCRATRVLLDGIKEMAR